MMTTEYKFGEVHKLATQIENGPERVVFKHIFENATAAYRCWHSKPDRILPSISLRPK